ISETLADAEVSAARMVLLVLADGRPKDADLAAVEVNYPKEFGLASAADLSAAIVEFQGIAAAAGDMPETTGESVQRLVAATLPRALPPPSRRRVRRRYPPRRRPRLPSIGNTRRTSF